MMRAHVLIDSTPEMLKEHANALQQFARGLAAIYDVNTQGDDYWTSYAIGDGAIFDINIWLDDEWMEHGGSRTFLKIAAYCVFAGGELDARHYRLLHQQPWRFTATTEKGNK